VICEECRAAAATKGLWNRYDSRKCVWCAARLLQAIGRRQAPREVLSKSKTASLRDSVAWGLDEAEIRKLAKGAMPLAPEVVEKVAKK